MKNIKFLPIEIFKLDYFGSLHPFETQVLMSSKTENDFVRQFNITQFTPPDKFVFSSCSSSSFLGAFAKLQKVTISFVVSVVRPSELNSAPAERMFMKFDICVFFGNVLRKLKFY